MWRKCFLVAVLIWTGCVFADEPVSVAPQALAVAPPVVILGAEFGIFSTGEKGEQVFEPSNVVPHELGQRYGWVIELRSRLRSVSVREEYLLPTVGQEMEMESDSKGETLKIKLPRRSQVSQRQLVPVDGKVFGEWSIGPQEPAGHRHLQVIVENEIAGDFEFDVQ